MNGLFPVTHILRVAKLLPPTGSWHFGVNANSQHSEEASEFVRWLTIEAMGADLWWSKDSFDMPAQKVFLGLL